MTERTIVLLRHAKAESPNDTSDIDRSLTERGHSDAAAAGTWLAHRGYLPDLVICSPARRTRQTWHGLAVALAESAATGSAGSQSSAVGPTSGAPAVRYETAVYNGGAEDLLDLVKTAGESVSTVLLVGHNPAISQLSVLLDPAGGGDFEGLRTSGIAVHRFNGAWAECEAGTAPLVVSHTARD